MELRDIKPAEALINSVRKLPAHGSVGLGDTESYINTGVYTNQEHFERERTSIFRKVPLPVTLSAYLSETRMVSCHSIDGVPVLLTRAADGTARAFLNACRHRGTKLVEAAEPTKLSRLVCPYHAWSYTLAGELSALPLPETFPSVDKREYGLIPLQCVEAGGLIWVCLGDAEAATADFSILTSQLGPELDGLGLAKLRVFRRKTYKVAANWKLIMDAFHENYHVRRLHSATLARFFRDGVSLSFPIGPHQRTMTPREGFDPADVAGEVTMEELGASVSVGYTLFPTGMVIGSPKYVSILLLNPVSRNETTADFYMLTEPDPQGENENLYERSFALMHVAFGEEDFRAAEIGQEGLDAGFLDRIILGGMEQRIRMFHDAVESYTAA